jgi:acyl-CoA thioesterase-1
MVARALFLLLVTVLIVGAGCDRDNGRSPAVPSSAPSTAPASRPAKLPRVVFLGDSLTAGLGVDQEQAFPAVVGQVLEAEGTPVAVVNAGVSGDTTAGGLRRLDWLLRQKPDVVVVGLGANDGLRGLKLEASEQNLREIVSKSRDAGAKVLILGMLIPPNYGPEYTSAFREIYPRLAKELNVGLVPFLLEGVGGEPRLNQPDGIHPTPEGHRIVARNVLPYLQALLPADDK